MPLYEYECKKCKRRFERIQKFSDDPIKKCPQCGGPVEKVISAPAVQFKGSGWYVTDYARKSSGSRESREDGKPSAEASGSEEKGAKSGKETSEGKPTSDANESKPKSDTKKSSKK